MWSMLRGRRLRHRTGCTGHATLAPRRSPGKRWRRLLAIGLTLAAGALAGVYPGRGHQPVAALAQEPDPATARGAPAPDPSVQARRAQNQALQSAVITADDLPIDEEGRSARTGRVIPGIRPRRPIPPEVQQALDSLHTSAARATESLATDPESVVITDLPGDPSRRPRMDSVAAGASAQPAVAPVERNR